MRCDVIAHVDAQVVNRNYKLEVTGLCSTFFSREHKV
jgi:hypothetical protein